MSRTRLTEVLRKIRSSLFFFITMSMVTALTVMTYTALSFSAQSLRESCEQYYDEHNFYDLQISCTTGFTDRMLQIVNDNLKVDQADIGYCYQDIISVLGDNYVAEFYTLPGELNTVRLVSGRLPTRANECTVEQAFLDRFSLNVGDTVALPSKNARMSFDSYKIVGSVDLVTVFVTDDFHNRGVSEIGDGQVATKILVTDEAFSEETQCNICAMTLKNAPERGSSNYNTLVAEVRDAVVPIVERMVSVEYETAKREASGSKRTAQQDYDRGQREYDRILKRIQDAVGDAEKMRIEYEQELQRLKNENEKPERIEEATKHLKDRLDNRQQRIYDWYAEQVDAENKIKDANERLEKANAELETLEEPYVFSMDIYSNPSYNSYVQMQKGTDTIIAALCSLLMAISMLVCFTTISRMITEDHRIIGTQKAMGFRSGEICSKYVVYAVICSLIGGGIGLAGSYYYLQQIVFDVGYGDAFIMQDYVPIINWRQTALILLLDMACMCSSAILACRQMLKMSAISLLNSEIRDAVTMTSADTRAPLGIVMTLRNLKGNPKILFTTIVSVTGCTIMMIAVFTVKTAMGGIADRQYDELQHYQGTLSVDDQAQPEDRAALRSYIENCDTVDTLPVIERFVAYQSRDKVRYATLICFDDKDNYGDFLELIDANSGEKLEVPTDGVYICKKLAENYGFYTGGRIALTNESGMRIYADIKGVVERNIGMAIISSTQYYEKLLNELPEITQFYVRGSGDAIDKFCTDARGYAAFCNYADSGYYRGEMESKMVQISTAIYVVFGCTWLLSLFVLFSLAQMNICKKEKDIIVMKVLGFPRRRINGYVFWESMVMCCIGLALGIALGGPVGSYLAFSIELEELQNIRGISWPACFVGGAVNFIFCTLANLFSLRVIKKIKMTGSAREA